MNKTAMTILLLVAVGLGWLLGTQTASRGSDATDEQVVRLQDENARLRRLLGERGPTLEPSVGLKGSGAAPGQEPTDSTGSQPGDPAQPVTSFDVTQFDHPDKAFRAFLRYAAAMLAKGAEGHLALLETIHRTFHEKPHEDVAEQLLGDEDRAARYLYPLVRFAMNHDAQVVDMTETIFKTMAEDPSRLAEIDNDPLELFTEGIAVLLPGMVDTQRLERFRGYVRGVLETPEARQPRSVQRQRRRLQRALESWAPPMSTEEALQRLRDGVATPEEAMSLLGRLGPEDVRGLDLDALIGPLLERDQWRVVSMVGRLRPDPATMARFDARLVRGVTAGSLDTRMVALYLRWTGRRTWSSARDFVEAGLQAGTASTNGAFLMAAFGLEPEPPAEWVDWAERTYAFDDKVRLFLKRRREQRDR